MHWPHKTLYNSQTGIALLIVIWLLTFLTVLVLSFSLMVRSEVYSTLSFKEEIENKLLAEAGIERGIMEIFYLNTNNKQNIILEDMDVVKADGREYFGHAGEGFYSFRIFDESGKININSLSDGNRIIMNNLLVNYGLSVDEADSIIDSILDWKDADELHRLNGAESDYYMSLPDSYRSKNSNFSTVEELLMVKGITPEILFGDAKNSAGIIHLITVYSKANKINLKTAPKVVLMAIPGFTDELADSIITLRDSGPDEIATYLSSFLGTSYELIAPYIDTKDSNIYTIEAKGYMKEKKINYAIRSTVIIERNNKYRVVYYKSPV
ncbi:MAG: general secretion pathway protein GspK [Proteobacteria bacterium]|nr:general secretion pathway protein GspK [Pseudomonadota bacterium]